MFWLELLSELVGVFPNSNDSKEHNILYGQGDVHSIGFEGAVDRGKKVEGLLDPAQKHECCGWKKKCEHQLGQASLSRSMGIDRFE